MEHRTEFERVHQIGSDDHLERHIQLLAASTRDKNRYDAYTTIEKDRALERLRADLDSPVASAGPVVVLGNLTQNRAIARSAA